MDLDIASILGNTATRSYSFSVAALNALSVRHSTCSGLLAGFQEPNIMTKTSRPYKESLLQALQDPTEAAEYLNAALEENESELFLLALRNVAEAHGMKILAEKALLNRESMYRMLSERGNPQLSSLTAILEQVGLKLAVEVKEPAPA